VRARGRSGDGGLRDARLRQAPLSPFTPPSGTLAICNTSGARAVTGSFSYTLTALASAGGTQVLTVPVGACTSKSFYNQGVTVTVTETVPPRDSVAAIALTGDTTSSASSNLAAGSAVVTVGSGQATLTFQTNGPLQHCVVPSVVGLTLPAAATSLRKHSCRPRRDPPGLFEGGARRACDQSDPQARRDPRTQRTGRTRPEPRPSAVMQNVTSSLCCSACGRGDDAMTSARTAPSECSTPSP
jgi:hypothetical protein